MGATDSVRRHYERRPYPPIPSAALPARGQGARIAYETGVLCAGREDRHDGIRILVAGCGTFEPALVRAVHPRAAEIVAVDLSARALGVLRRRLALQALSSALKGRRLPPVRLRRADLESLSEREVGRFAYVIATGVLHHHEDPGRLLGVLARLLEPGGLLRAAVYPLRSRFWITWTGRWLALGGVRAEQRGLARAARRRVRELPSGHPIRSSFEANPDARTSSGVADAYFHPLERPLTFGAWAEAAHRAGLRLAGEASSDAARSAALDRIVPEAAGLDAWTKLDILDDLLLLGSWPIFWLTRGEIGAPPPEGGTEVGSAVSRAPGPLERDGALVLERGRIAALLREEAGRRRLMRGTWLLPSPIRWELAEGLRRAARRLEPFGIDAASLRRRLERRADEATRRRASGLALADQVDDEALALPPPPGDDEWTEAERALDLPGLRREVSENLLREGSVRSWVGPWLPAALRGGTSSGS